MTSNQRRIVDAFLLTLGVNTSRGEFPAPFRHRWFLLGRLANLPGFAPFTPCEESSDEYLDLRDNFAEEFPLLDDPGEPEPAHPSGPGMMFPELMADESTAWGREWLGWMERREAAADDPVAVDARRYPDRPGWMLGRWWRNTRKQW
jgi:hypothetical protein